mgnify:CR=1 FL=1
MQKENNLPTDVTDDSVVVYHDYFSSLTENVIGTDDPDEYNPNGEASKIIPYNSVYECINKDIESLYEGYEYKGDIATKAKELSAMVNSDRFIHILIDSLASLGASVKNTIEYFYNIDTGIRFAQNLARMDPAIFTDLFSSILELMTKMPMPPQDIISNILLVVDKFVAEVFNELHANILVMCVENVISDTEKCKMLNIIYPLLVTYHDSLLRSITLYISQSMELEAFRDSVKGYSNE